MDVWVLLSNTPKVSIVRSLLYKGRTEASNQHSNCPHPYAADS